MERLNSVSKKFPKHLMIKFGLFKYAAEKGKTHIIINYDGDTGDGQMDVFIDYDRNQSLVHSDKSQGESTIPCS